MIFNSIFKNQEHNLFLRSMYNTKNLKGILNSLREIIKTDGISGLLGNFFNLKVQKNNVFKYL